MRQAFFLFTGGLAMSCNGAPPPSASDAAASDLSVAVAPAAPTWGNFAQGFFAMYCTRCHGAGNTKRDYTQYSQVQRDANEIACGVNPGPAALPGCPSFPPPGQFPIGNGPFPTDAERTQLVQWIQAGLTM